jgi:hypothetical protein
MLDTQAQFMLADFQQCPELLHLLRVHAINAMSCVAVTKVMLVTVCLKRKAAAPRPTKSPWYASQTVRGKMNPHT